MAIFRPPVHCKVLFKRTLHWLAWVLYRSLQETFDRNFDAFYLSLHCRSVFAMRASMPGQGAPVSVRATAPAQHTRAQFFPSSSSVRRLALQRFRGRSAETTPIPVVSRDPLPSPCDWASVLFFLLGFLRTPEDITTRRGSDASSTYDVAAICSGTPCCKWDTLL
ncbi:hypothetical protein TRVL_07944 [Trypanosoma vivax]|nr:hypothetical protein TRVL_07944 [Trypanosoma vivax]